MEKEKIILIVYSLCSLIYITLTSTISENVYVLQESTFQAPLDQKSTFWISANALGYYIGVKILKYSRTKVFILPVNMFLLIFILNFVAFMLLYLPANFINSTHNLFYFIFTLSKVISGISQIMALLELILILRYKNDEQTKRWLFFFFPIAQLLGLAFTFEIFSEKLDFYQKQTLEYCCISILSLNILIIFFQNKEKLKNYSESFQYNKAQLEEEKNSNYVSANSEIKFMKILILLFISTTQDQSYILPFLLIPVVIFINFIHVFFYKRINVKLTLILGQVIVIIGFIFQIFNTDIGIFIVQSGNQVGIGSSQYYIIQKQLNPIQIIDYFETYSILLLLLISLNSSYMSNLIKFYMTSIGLKLIVTIIMTVLMIMILKKSKIDGGDSKKNQENNQEKEKEIEREEENNNLSQIQ